MLSNTEAQHLMGVTAGKVMVGSEGILTSLKSHQKVLKDPLSKKICGQALADFVSGNNARINDAYRRFYAHVYLVDERDREGIAFLSGIMEGWAKQQGIEVTLAA